MSGIGSCYIDDGNGNTMVKINSTLPLQTTTMLCFNLSAHGNQLIRRPQSKAQKKTKRVTIRAWKLSCSSCRAASGKLIIFIGRNRPERQNSRRISGKGAD